MLSSKLIQMVEDHWEQIAGRVMKHVRHNPNLAEFNKLPESDLHERAKDLVKYLGNWLARGDHRELAQRYEELGKHRFEESIPLYELVFVFQLIREQLVDFVRDQGLAQTTVDLYAEEELEHELGRFFDRVVYHLVRGYELKMREVLGIGVH